MPASNRFPSICIALGLPEPSLLFEHASRELAQGERFFEFRLDYLPDPRSGVEIIRRLRSEHPECVVLATCRRHQNHGRFKGSVTEQLEILMEALEAGAAAVDIEIESAEALQGKLDVLRRRAALILSYHNYEGTPPVEPVLRRLQRFPADIYKLVTTGRKPSDNLRVLSLGKSKSAQALVPLVMGEFGFPSRVLSPLFHGLYTYAAPSGAEGTAAGQVCARQLRKIFRIDKLTRETRIYAVIGDPIQHSISPAVHNSAFHARRYDGVYVPFLVRPQQVKDFMQVAESLPLAGFSVTIPHKQRIIRYLDSVDPLARRIGAVNTVWRKAGRWRGTNTDATAVTTPLKKLLKLARARVLVVGNGGAARGAAFALAAEGARVSIVGRNPDRVRALARACGAEAVLKDNLSSLSFDAVVHATPIGMFPKTDECFFEDRIPAPVVFEMVYTPRATELVRRALAQKCQVIYGLEMFLAQAAAQFEIWTGLSAPRAAMQRAALEALEHQMERLRQMQAIRAADGAAVNSG